MEKKYKKQIIRYAVSCLSILLLTTLTLYVFDEFDYKPAVVTSYVIAAMACVFFGVLMILTKKIEELEPDDRQQCYKTGKECK